MNVSTPELEPRVNIVASTPPLLLNVRVSAGTSASVAVTVVTAVSFSATSMAAVSPPKLLVITGTALAVVKFQYAVSVTAAEPTLDALTMSASIST